MNEALTQKLSAVLQRSLPKNYTSVSYAISYKGQILCADSLGYQDGSKLHPATTSCTYNVASVSKIYCTTAVMQLVEQGKVDLDTPIVEYLPDFKMLDERYRQITLRHCLNHTSGLPGTQWKHFSTADVSENHYYEEVYDYMAHSYLKAAPGEYSTYCNDGFTLAEMVVAQVSGQSYAEYCMEHITEPIGAHSSRLSPVRNTDYPLVKEGKKPGELLLIQGGAGYTTTMMDLCKFGQQFLGDSKILSQKSKEEMSKRQGATFLEEDIRSTAFGLGWDSVCYSDPDYDLGEGVLQKSGNSFQFTTQFMVFPKYDAVLAISETHDCGLDVPEVGLRLLVTALYDQGVNLFSRYQPVPQELAQQLDGTYLVPSAILHTHFYGSFLDISMDSVRGGSHGYLKALKYDGKEFVGENDSRYFFVEKDGDTFLMSNLRGKVAPMAMKAPKLPAINDVWRSRLGKKYVLCSTSPWDLIPCELMTGFVLKSLPEQEGILVASCSGRSDSGVYGLFEGTFAPVTDTVGTGFLRTPANGSRDLLTPCFEVKEDAEYCTLASYTFRDVDSLPVYSGQGFEGEAYDHQTYNQVYTLPHSLDKLPHVPENRRLIVLDDNMTTVYDSLMGGKYEPVKKGYLILV